MLDEEPIDVCKATFVMAVKDAVNVVSGKWKLAIVCALLQEDQRFRDLERLLAGITPRSLSKDLKDLELNGIISRTMVTGTDTVTARYALTRSGRSLEKVIMEMAGWGQLHRQLTRDATVRPCQSQTTSGAGVAR